MDESAYYDFVEDDDEVMLRSQPTRSSEPVTIPSSARPKPASAARKNSRRALSSGADYVQQMQQRRDSKVGHKITLYDITLHKYNLVNSLTSRHCK
jgi:hypothetical protein